MSPKNEPDPRSDVPRVPADRALDLLCRGDIALLGLLPNSSNYTFLCRVSLDGLDGLAVYKPRDGETPLRDFPEGTLWQREIAAYHVAERLGLGFVPVTVAREGPHGVGSLQLYVEHDASRHYLNMPAVYDDTFRLVCAFDLVINNADRKAGHCLLDARNERVWMVDHGVSFHEQTKVRTVIWDFAGEQIPGPALEAIARLARSVEDDPGPLAALLDQREIAALARRAQRVAEARIFPEPGPGRPFPWPPV